MKIIGYVALAIAGTVVLLYGYQKYGDDIHLAVFGVPSEYTIFIDKVALTVTLADEPEERKQGLSGVGELAPLEGKLFLFDEAKNHGIWMKDMLLPLDIIWINNDLEIVHIEENIQPDTFPEIFGPDVPARYVLEMNAFFVDTYRIEEGDRISLPPALLPFDIKKRLLEDEAE